MELKEFIKASITAIVEAEYDLSKDLTDKGVIISPSSGYPVARERYTGSELYCEYGKGQRGFIRFIEFDLSVNESNDSNAHGGFSIKVLKAGVNTNSGTEIRNNIRFSIPLTFVHKKD